MVVVVAGVVEGEALSERIHAKGTRAATSSVVLESCYT